MACTLLATILFAKHVKVNDLNFDEKNVKKDDRTSLTTYYEFPKRKLYITTRNTIIKMKKILIVSVYGCFLLFGCQLLQAQQTEEKTVPPTTKELTVAEKIALAEEEEKGPSMYKFEPDFIAATDAKKARIEMARKILDTMDISERKKRKLLKDLYKSGISDRLSKTILADVKFEDDVDN